MRKELCADLGFSNDDRRENVRRISYVATLIARNGPIVLVAVISPLRSMREAARRTITGSTTHFCEVFRRSTFGMRGTGRQGVVSASSRRPDSKFYGYWIALRAAVIPRRDLPYRIGNCRREYQYSS